MPRSNFMPRLPLLGLAVLALTATGCANTRALDTTSAGATDEAATLFVPYQFQVAAIDDTVVRDSFAAFDGRDQTLDIAPGRHTLKLRYFDLIEDDGDRTDDYARVLSEPITVAFEARANRRYAVVGARPDTPEAGTAFAAGPELSIQARATGEPVNDPITVAKPDVDTIRRGNTVFAPIGPATASTPEAAPAPTPAGASPQSYDMLKYWWNNASQADRRRFAQWRASDHN